MHVISVGHGVVVVGGFPDQDGAEKHLQANGWTPPARSGDKEWRQGPRTAIILRAFRCLSDLPSV